MMRSIAQLRAGHRRVAFAPAACCAAFLIIWIVGRLDGSAQSRDQVDARVNSAEVLIDAIPYRLGAWAGIDVAFPEGVLEILHSEAATSRAYTHLTSGDQASFSLVFCGDVRDMLGHHPPSCYPRSGWEVGPDPTTRLSVRVGSRRADANIFRFRMVTSEGVERKISVLGFFVLPTVGFTADAQLVSDAAMRRAISAQGSGQVQVVMDGWVEASRIKAVAEDLLGAMPASTFESLLRLPADVEPRALP